MKTHLEQPDEACCAEFINNKGYLAQDSFLYVTRALAVFFIPAFFTLGRCVCNVLCKLQSTT